MPTKRNPMMEATDADDKKSDGDMTHVSGLDLGQSADFTAFCVLKRWREKKPGDRKGHLWHYRIRHIERFDLGTSYTSIAEQLVLRYESKNLKGTDLAVDKTGVGSAVVDMVKKEFRLADTKCNVRPITITSGGKVTPDGAGYKVAKKELVSVLQVLLQSRRLTMVSGIPNSTVLIKELENFKVKITASANETFESWRERDHDDVVLAVAMACWLGEKGMKEFWFKG